MDDATILMKFRRMGGHHRIGDERKRSCTLRNLEGRAPHRMRLGNMVQLEKAGLLRADRAYESRLSLLVDRAVAHEQRVFPAARR